MLPERSGGAARGFVRVGAERVGGVFVVVVARQGPVVVQFVLFPQQGFAAFALVVQVLEEFLYGAGGRLGFVVFGGVVVDPEGVFGAVDEVEQGAEVFVFAVLVAGARTVKGDEVVAFVVLARRVVVAVGVHEDVQSARQVAQVFQAADGDDAARFAAVLLGGEVGFDVFVNEGGRQVVCFVLRGEGCVAGELLLEFVQRLVDGLPGRGVLGVGVVVVQGVTQLLESCLCGDGGVAALGFGLFGQGGECFERGQVGQCQAGLWHGVAVVFGVGGEDAGDEAVQGVGVGVAVVVVVRVQRGLELGAVVAAFVARGGEGGGDALYLFGGEVEAVAGVRVVQPVVDGRRVVAAVGEGVAAAEGAPEGFGAVFGDTDVARGQVVAVVVAAGREGGAQDGLCGDGVGQVDVDVGEATRRVGVEPGGDVAAQGFALALEAVAAVDAQAVVFLGRRSIGGCFGIGGLQAIPTPDPSPTGGGGVFGGGFLCGVRFDSGDGKVIATPSPALPRCGRLRVLRGRGQFGERGVSGGCFGIGGLQAIPTPGPSPTGGGGLFGERRVSGGRFGIGGLGKVCGDVVFAQFADFGLQGGEEVVRGDGGGVGAFGVAVFVQQAGEVALLFAVARDEFVAVFAVAVVRRPACGAAFEVAQPAAVHDVVDVVFAGGEVVVGEVGVFAEALHGVAFGSGHAGRRKDGYPARQQFAGARAGVEDVPEGLVALFARGVDGGEAVVPEAALLLVVGAVVVGKDGWQGFQAVAVEEVVQRRRVVALPGGEPVGALVEVGGVEVGELTAVAPEAAGHGGGEAGFVRVECAQ